MIMLFQTLVLSLGQTLPTEITSHDADNNNPAASMALSGFPSGFTTTLESHSAGSSEASNNASSVDEVSDDHHYADNETAADNEATADNGSNDDDDDDCKIPDDLREMNRTMGSLLSLPEPDPLNRTYSDTNLFKDAENVKRHLWKNPDACPTSSSGLPNRRSADVEDRSACPWYYELDINTYRWVETATPSCGYFMKAEVLKHFHRSTHVLRNAVFLIYWVPLKTSLFFQFLEFAYHLPIIKTLFPYQQSIGRLILLHSSLF